MKISDKALHLLDQNLDPWRVHSQALEARARGEDVILLTIGDPDQDSPPSAIEAATVALKSGDTHYINPKGKQNLRNRIAQHRSLSGTIVNADQITIVPGVQAGIFAAVHALFDPGSEVLVVEPSFVSYCPIVEMVGARAVRVPADPTTLRMGAIENYINPRTKGIIYSDPANPTGIVFTHQELTRIAELSVKHSLWVISDEIYSNLCWGTKPTSISKFAGMKERTVILDGTSKRFAMTGWRVGWTIAPSNVSPAIDTISDTMNHGIAGFVQEGALAALMHGSETTSQMILDCARRACILAQTLRGAPGIQVLTPESGIFCMIDVSGTGLSGLRFAQLLFQHCGVAVLAGSAFGGSTKDWVRISFSVSDGMLQEACRRIERFCYQTCILEQQKDQFNNGGYYDYS